MSGPALAIAYGFFVANYLFGVSVAAGLVDHTRFRSFHHRLYFLVMLSLGCVIIPALWRGEAQGYRLILLFLLLLGMPLFKGRSRAHPIYATLCLVLYSLLLFL